MIPQNAIDIRMQSVGDRSIISLCTIGTSLLRNAGVNESASLDAELLLAHALKKEREYLLSHGEEVVPSVAVKRFYGMLERRAKHEPMAYILGRKEFYGMEFFVNKHVLIPRPKTEEMVERARKIITNYQFPISNKIQILKTKSQKTHTKYAMRNTSYNTLVIDVGTGSGILAVTIQKLFPDVAVLAIDVSKRALHVAMRNAEKQGIKVVESLSHRVIEKESNSIHFLQSDLLSKVGEVHSSNVLILANLPYVPTREIATLERDVKDYEPKKALDGGSDGLDLFRRLAKQIRQTFPDKNVKVIWECEEEQEEEVKNIFSEYAFS